MTLTPTTSATATTFDISFEHIEKTFNYKPFFGNTQKLVDALIQEAATYLPLEAVPAIQQAYVFAEKAHAEKKRLSGEAYIVHPVRAAQILLELKPDIKTIQACILHDVIEDTPYTYQNIEKEFGSEVADLCEGVSKVSNVKYSNNNEQQLETLKKTFLAMAKDLRVIFLKLADRIHNIQTLHFHPKEEKRNRIAQETMKVYVPIAKKLGLFKFALYLENGAFKNLEPQIYQDIITFFQKKYRNAPKYIKDGTRTIGTLLQKNGITDFVIRSRLKSPYRIYEKLKKKYGTEDFTKVLDVLAFRIITKSLSDCYTVLGLIHSQRRPIISKIKDYIAIPKFNNYQSLHTTVLGMFPFPTEIQIRTKDMDDIAEFGVAAHFAYSENNNSVVITKKQSQWIKELQDIVNSYSTLETKETQENFSENLNIEFFTKSVFIYTPKGDVIELPEKSTILDFAFRIHSDVGLRFKNALVNGVIKPINFILKTGDVVAISTFRNKYSATEYWIDFLHTPTGKAKLQKFLKQQSKEEYLKRGKEIVNEKLKSYGLPTLGSEEDCITKEISEEAFERRMFRIADKQESPGAIIRDVYPQKHQEFHEKQKKSGDKKEGVLVEKQHVVIVDTDKNLTTLLCPVCAPTLDHKIIARTGRGGIKVHSLSCAALKTISFDKLLEAHWLGEPVNVYTVKLILEATQQSGGLIGVMALFSELHVDIENVSVERTQQGTFLITIQSSYTNPTKVGIMLHEIQKHAEIIRVIKKEIG